MWENIFKDKGKFHPGADHERTEGEQMYSRSRWGWVDKPRPGFSTPRNDPVPIVEKAGCNPKNLWKTADNIAHDGI